MYEMIIKFNVNKTTSFLVNFRKETDTLSTDCKGSAMISSKWFQFLSYRLSDQLSFPLFTD